MNSASFRSRWTAIASAVFFLLAMAAQAAIDLNLAPHNGIYDRGEFLDRDYRQTIGDRIDYEQRNRNFEIFVLILEDEPEIDAEVLARRAGESWANSSYWAVVYQVGADGDPDCVVGGGKMEQILPDEIAHTLRGARGAAMLVESPQGRVEELVNNLGDGFGFLYEKADQRFLKAVREAEAKARQERKREESNRVVFMFLFVVFLLLGALGFYLWNNFISKMKPVEFPLTAPRRRLSAPSSGGGDVLVKYRNEG